MTADLERRLHEAAADSSSTSSLMTPDDLAALAVAAMSKAQLRPPLMKTLLQCIIDLPVDDEMSKRALSLLFQTGCSNSGTDVKVSHPIAPPSGSSPSTGVLILGFAGASMGMIELLGKSYQKWHPTWRVVATTRSGVSDARAISVREEQLRQIESGLGGCDRILIHAMSNNGFGLWSEVVARVPAVCARVKAVVNDCVGPAETAAFPTEAAMQVIKQTILSAAFINQLEWTPPHDQPTERELGNLIDAACRAAVEDLSDDSLLGRTFISPIVRPHLSEGQGAIEWFAEHEPDVPTLFLTASDDIVIPHSHSSTFRDALKAARPQRRLRLERLHGQHVRLIHQSPADFQRHVEALITEAGLTEPAAALDARADGAAAVDITEPPAAVDAEPPPELDSKMASFMRRLERLAGGKGVRLGSKEIANLELLACKCVVHPTLQANYLKVRVQGRPTLPSLPLLTHTRVLSECS